MEIAVTNLTRTFGKTKAVDDLSFNLHPGKIYAFVGPNGAGKTTTMRIMATLDQPDSGTVTFDGMPVPQYPEKARRLLGYMPDNLPGHRDIVVHEYLDFFARAFGMRGSHRTVVLKEIEEFTGLGPMRDKPLSALSKGMKQRVSLARAIVHDPPLLILDEPAAGLDPRARIDLRRLLLALASQGKTIFISSHILNELEEMSTGAVIIEAGKLVRAGTMEELHTTTTSEGHATRKFGIRCLGDHDAALRSVLETAFVHHAEVAGPAIAVELIGGDAEAAELLKILVEAGHRPVECTPARAGLEQMFMEMTRGTLQ